jgi:hypothetical protein
LDTRFQTKLLLVLLAIPANADAQSRYLLRGEITDGSSLFPPREFDPNLTWENYGDPPEGYPIDYSARLNIGPGDDWSFHFTAMSDDRDETYSVTPPVRPSLEVGPETLVINHVGGSPFVEWFTVDLNLDAGVGSWSWRQDCQVCDLLYPLPSAFATVTSIVIATGDFDDNGLWDIDDIDTLMAQIANGGKDLTFDLTGDGVVDDLDRDDWLAEAGTQNGFARPFLLGDSDLDGTVNVSDMGGLGLAWQTDEDRWSWGNFSGKGVTSKDLNALAVNWRKSVPIAVAVPEPSLGLNAFALLIAVIARFRWR